MIPRQPIACEDIVPGATRAERSMNATVLETRDRRIDDPTNLWFVHPVGRLLLPYFLAGGVSANSVSVGGLMLGALAAGAFAQWATSPPLVWVGLILAVGWLVADGLDGMIARATGTAGPAGRLLDGLCDHGTFVVIYVLLATSVGTVTGWVLACSAGACHVLQANFYEGERARFHRRRDGLAGETSDSDRNIVVQAYDRLSSTVDRYDGALTNIFANAPDRSIADAYIRLVQRPLRLMRLLSANMRVYTVFVACLLEAPALFWWFELGPMTGILIVGVAWRNRIDAKFVAAARTPASISATPANTL